MITNYFRPSIAQYGSIGDCKMVLDELKIDLRQLELTPEQLESVYSLIEAKKDELEPRYFNWK
ncbi:hypothetical protein SAMN05880501_10781 [Ureibacillus xyleni]|uniref:Uncharacterized protein n=1 Tax=Ureibacillus xyleni TaxID=614648 RepID=A0A285SXG6_9BACL|nr:hypothetical protein [Ureibacillus xyleni]SOC12964.1 hypothetical protein SAMN05880501_10781 [Ureibacillus xyleni]